METRADRDRLRPAYEATEYRVDAGPHGRFSLRVGARSPEVDALLAAAGVDTWAFVTACNPRSVRLAAEENARRMAALRERVLTRGLVHHVGVGVAAAGDWLPEPSLLLLGVSLQEATALARAFDQLAIVAGRRGEPARLVWVEADGAAP